MNRELRGTNSCKVKGIGWLRPAGAWRRLGLEAHAEQCDRLTIALPRGAIRTYILLKGSMPVFVVLVLQNARQGDWNLAFCMSPRMRTSGAVQVQVLAPGTISLWLKIAGTGDAKEGRLMKKLEALLPVMTADDVVEELRTLDIENLVTTHVTVMDKKHPHKMIYRGCVYDQPFDSRVKVEVSVSDEDAERAEELLGLCAAH